MLTKFNHLMKLINCILYLQQNQLHMCRNITKLANIYVNMSTYSQPIEPLHSTVLSSNNDKWFIIACHTYVSDDYSTTLQLQAGAGSEIHATIHGLRNNNERGITPSYSLQYECKLLSDSSEEELFQQSLIQDEVGLFCSYLEYMYHPVLNGTFYVSVNASRLLGFSTKEVQDMIDIFEAELSC